MLYWGKTNRVSWAHQSPTFMFNLLLKNTSVEFSYMSGIPTSLLRKWSSIDYCPPFLKVKYIIIDYSNFVNVQIIFFFKE
jgi:hypothetical protein